MHTKNKTITELNGIDKKEKGNGPLLKDCILYKLAQTFLVFCSHDLCV